MQGVLDYKEHTMTTINHEQHHIYIDGAAPDNQRGCTQGGIGVAFYDADHQLLDTYKETIRPPMGVFTTNQRCELLAFVYALKRACTNDIIYTDSAYVKGGYDMWLEGWKAKGWRKADKKQPEHLDLWQLIDELKQALPLVKVAKVKGHSGIEGNELADKLACEAALGR